MPDLKELEIYNCLVIHHSTTIPQRSRLFFLEPIGVGTPLTESLSSYLTRLAQEHCVTPKKLIMGEIAPLIMSDKYQSEMLSKNVSTLFGNSDAKPAINGMRDMTESLTVALESLTLREDLRYLSCLTWKGIIRERGLFRQHKAWCPQCFEQWRQENKSIYEPLLWSFKDVNYCSQHHGQLVDRCPHCDSQLKAISDRSILGFCDRCKKFLGNSIKVTLNANETDLSNIQVISSLITVAPSLDFPLKLDDLMYKLQLIHFSLQKAFNQDLTKFFVLGKTMEQLKITFTKHNKTPLNLIKLMIPLCNFAQISVSQLFKEDPLILSQIILDNFEVNCKYFLNLDHISALCFS